MTVHYLDPSGWLERRTKRLLKLSEILVEEAMRRKTGIEKSQRRITRQKEGPKINVSPRGALIHQLEERQQKRRDEVDKVVQTRVILTRRNDLEYLKHMSSDLDIPVSQLKSSIDRLLKKTRQLEAEKRAKERMK